jgi:hypothetical protein
MTIGAAFAAPTHVWTCPEVSLTKCGGAGANLRFC